MKQINKIYPNFTGDLKRHVEGVHEGIKPHPCQLCSYSAPSKTYLNIHIDTVHKRLKPFSCKLCNFVTGQKGNHNYLLAIYLLGSLVIKTIMFINRFNSSVTSFFLFLI